MPVVDLDRISKSYSSKAAVRELSLRIEQGTIFGLLGPNGAGKTSTIRMMVGMTLPDSGTVRLFDEPFRRDHLRRVGYLPEERGLYKRMKVIDQLVFMGQLHGLEAAAAKAARTPVVRADGDCRVDGQEDARSSRRACSRRSSSSPRCCTIRS